MAKLTHIDDEGAARMVEVGSKDRTERTATAEGRVRLAPEAFDALVQGNLRKGDALGTARIAGIMAAKRTHELIPLCHPIAISGVTLELEPVPSDSTVVIRGTVKAVDRTGVEMEALTAVSVAALTIYDMCKALDREITIETIHLLEKRGGTRGDFGK